jgi:DNA-directed RNA polymerase specialized sigma24 family protein
MADRIDQRPEPQRLTPDALASEVDGEINDELLAGGQPEEPDAPDATTANEKKADPEPLPPAESVSEREMDTFLRQLYASRAALDSCVRGRVRDADVEDVVQEALIAVRRLKRLPTGEKERLQYARAIARNKAVTWYRRMEKKRTDEVAFDDVRGEAVECSRLQGAIHGEQLEKIAETVPLKQRETFVCLARHLLLGESLAEMARERGVEYDTFYKRIATLHRHVKDAGKALGGLVMMVVVLAGAWRVLAPPDEVARPAPSSWTAPPSPAPGSPEALQRARELRDQAFRACTQDDWATCERGLDGARELDPQGESDPRVHAARADVQAAAKHGEGTGWSPKRPRAYEEGAR